MNRADANQDNVLEIAELLDSREFWRELNLGTRPYLSPRSYGNFRKEWAFGVMPTPKEKGSLGRERLSLPPFFSAQIGQLLPLFYKQSPALFIDAAILHCLAG